MRLNIHIEIPEEEDVERVKDFLVEQLEDLFTNKYAEKTTVSLTREGDRSGKNLFLPRLDGRFGNHLQSKKATLAEIFSFKE